MKNKTKDILMSIIVISMLTISMVTVTRAWFRNNTDAGTGGLETQVESVDEMKVSFDNKNWDNKIQLNGLKNIKDVTGDGYNFFTPRFKEEVENGIISRVVDGYQLIETNKQKDYINVNEFFIQNNSRGGIHISRDSFISPWDVDDASRLYKNVSKDYISGAIRVAFYTGVQNGSTYDWTLNTIWIPNTEFMLESYSTVFRFTKNGIPENRYDFISSTNDEPIRINTFGQSNGVTRVGSVKYIWGDLNKKNGDNYFFTDNDLLLSDETYKSVPVKTAIWIDGNDRECDKALIGGKIKANLVFKN